jgi:hypothetical protein
MGEQPASALKGPNIRELAEGPILRRNVVRRLHRARSQNSTESARQEAWPGSAEY